MDLLLWAAGPELGERGPWESGAEGNDVGSSFTVPVQTPSPHGAFTALAEHALFVAFNTCGLATLRPVGTSPGQVGRAERWDGRLRCPWAAGGLPQRPLWSAVLQPGLGAQVVGGGRWAVGGAGGQRALSGPARQPGSLRRAGPRVPASRDPGSSLALKSL